LIGGSVVLAGDGMLLLVILALSYLGYLVPTQFFLSQLGKKRRYADDSRLEFVSNVASASREFQLSSQKNEFVNKFLYIPTTIIKNALVVKWVNSESQKSILEVIILLSLFIYLTAFAESMSDVQFLLPLSFMGYRIAPLLSRVMVAAQSVSFGMSSIREPVASKYELNVNVEFKSKVREVKYTGNFDEIIDGVCKDGRAGVTLISGVSGVGKSTLLFESAKNRKLAQKVAYVGQNSFIAHTSLINNIPNFIDQSDLLELFELSDLLQRDNVSFSQVSGGQAQRISILRAIVSDADELYFDEPFSSINREKIEQISRLLNEIGKHKPIFLVSHITPEFLEVKNEIRITGV
jgi:ABC-type lipoprotein export system ATPase subunit